MLFYFGGIGLIRLLSEIGSFRTSMGGSVGVFFWEARLARRCKGPSLLSIMYKASGLIRWGEVG